MADQERSDRRGEASAVEEPTYDYGGLPVPVVQAPEPVLKSQWWRRNMATGEVEYKDAEEPAPGERQKEAREGFAG